MIIAILFVYSLIISNQEIQEVNTELPYGSITDTLNKISLADSKYSGYAFSASIDDTEIDASAIEVYHSGGTENGYINVRFPYENQLSFAKVIDNKCEFSNDSSFDFNKTTNEKFFAEYPEQVNSLILSFINSNAFTVLDNSENKLILFTSVPEIIYAYYPVLTDTSLMVEGYEGKSLVDVMRDVTSAQMSIDITYDEDDVTVFTNAQIFSEAHALKLSESLASYSKEDTLKDVFKSFEDSYYLAQNIEIEEGNEANVESKTDS